MFRHYKFIYTLSSILGLSPFSLQESNGTITIFFSKFKLFYSYTYFVVSLISLVLLMTFECYKTITLTFLSLSSILSIEVLWIVTYCNNFYHYKRLTSVYKDLYDLKSLKIPQQSNIYYNFSFILNFTILVLFLVNQIYENILNENYFSEKCFTFYYIQYWGYFCAQITYILIITELRNVTITWSKTLQDSEIKISTRRLENYRKISKRMQDIFMRAHYSNQVPVALLLGWDFVNILDMFNNFMGDSMDWSYKGLSSLYDFYTFFLWILNAFHDIIVMTYHIHNCKQEVGNIF